MAFRDEPADFWIGVGMVAEAPIMLMHWLLPAGSCDVLLGRFVECPLSRWGIALAALVSYISVAWFAHRRRNRARRTRDEDGMPGQRADDVSLL